MQRNTIRTVATGDPRILEAPSSPTVVAHYTDVIMGAIASQITNLTIVYSTVYSGADQRKHQSSASLAFVRGIHRGQVNSPHKWPVTRKMFPFDDVIMQRRNHSAMTYPSPVEWYHTLARTVSRFWAATILQGLTECLNGSWDKRHR